MLAAPLIAGNDLRTMSVQTRRILTNTEVIAVDQDPLGVQGLRWRAEGDVEIWFKPLAGAAWAVCVLNRGAAARPVELDWANEPMADDLSGRKAAFDTTVYRVRDLWEPRDLGTTEQPLRAEVPGHDVLMVRLEPLAKEAER